MIDISICDKCGENSEMVPGAYDNPNELPKGWKSTEVGDLCPKCLNLWGEHKTKFKKR